MSHYSLHLTPLAFDDSNLYTKILNWSLLMHWSVVRISINKPVFSSFKMQQQSIAIFFEKRFLLSENVSHYQLLYWSSLILVLEFWSIYCAFFYLLNSLKNSCRFENLHKKFTQATGCCCRYC